MFKPTPDDVADRQNARAAARAANASLDYALSDDDADSRYLTYRSQDPFPDRAPSLLSSADIADYVSKTGMIRPFRPDKLKTASYEVSLLGDYVLVNEKGKVTRGVIERGKDWTLPKNSIVFVSVEPYFRIPDYIALRHNLKISHIYKGLLVGTGPLIDPGFVGRIYLPLHNLTEHKYVFKGGDGIIWIEFTKLTLSPNSPTGGQYTNFPAEATYKKTLDEYISDAVRNKKVPESNTAAIARTARRARTIAAQTRRIFYGVSVAGVIGLLSFSFLLFNTIQNQNQVISTLRERVTRLEATESPVTTAVPTPTASPKRTRHP